MTGSIPIYNINKLLEKNEDDPEVFIADHHINNRNLPIDIPYRGNYFGISICIQGEATLNANLETYSITKDCIVMTSPQTIKQWGKLSDDYQTVAVFFTKEFFIQNTQTKNYLDNFDFFDLNAKHSLMLNIEKSEEINALFSNIKLKLDSSHVYKTEIVHSLITILLYEILSIYGEQGTPLVFKRTRSEQIASEFKKMVNLHFTKERSVKFYSDLLFVTPKHLTEITKAETGKSAKEWIDEIVILESMVLLQNFSLPVSDIANILSFADQSTFGKFFKNSTGFSPQAYRQNQ